MKLAKQIKLLPNTIDNHMALGAKINDSFILKETSKKSGITSLKKSAIPAEPGQAAAPLPARENINISG